MEIEVLYLFENENGKEELTSETLSEYGDTDLAIKSAEGRFSGRKIEILAMVVHDPKKVEKVSDIVRRIYVQNRRKATA